MSKFTSLPDLPDDVQERLLAEGRGVKVDAHQGGGEGGEDGILAAGWSSSP